MKKLGVNSPKMVKIKKRTKEEKEDTIKSITRECTIRKVLNEHFEPNSIDLKDKETLIEWACFGVPKENLVYILEKIKMRVLE